MRSLFSNFHPKTSNEPEEIWGIPSPRIADTRRDNGAGPPPSRLYAEETYEDIIAAVNESYTSGDQLTLENFVWDTNEAAALVDTAHDDRTSPPHSASSTRMPSAKAVANNNIVNTFDDFLNSGDFCSLKNFAWDPKEAAALSLANIRDWHNNATHLESDFDTEFLNRRTNLWKLVLLQESLPLYKQYILPFIAPPAHTSRVAPYVLRAPNARLPLQQIHISHHAIPAVLADTRANNAPQLLAYLNDICETDVVLTPDLHAFLEARSKLWDVGTVYGSVRAWWADFAMGKLTLEVIESRIRIRKAEDKSLRYDNELPYNSGAPGSMPKLVINTEVPPRRIWDLYSNRVLPYYVFASLVNPIPANVWAVSHSWVVEARRTNVWTSVNGQQWPVPLPTDVSLEQVRIELLNMGAEYVFLDVLCLRQLASPDAEEARLREWRLDVPTLGRIYRHTRHQTVVVYFNGLGLPFDAEGSGLASPFHWFNRAWTLQETALNWLPGGLTAQDCTRWDGRAFLRRLFDAQHALGLVGVTQEPRFVSLLRAMQRRPGYADKKPYDRVAALAYLIPYHHPHVYTESTAHVEDMWRTLVWGLPMRDLLYLLLFGAGGDTSRAIPAADARRYWESRRKGRYLLWRPAWEDIIHYPEDMPRELGNRLTGDDELCVYMWWAPLLWPTHQIWYRHWAYVVKDPTVIDDRIVVNRNKYRMQGGAENTFVFKTNFGLEYVPPHADGLSSQRLVLVGIGGLECWLLCVTRGHGTVKLFVEPALAVYQKLGVFYVSDPQVRQRIKEEALGEYSWVGYCDNVKRSLW